MEMDNYDKQNLHPADNTDELDQEDDEPLLYVPNMKALRGSRSKKRLVIGVISALILVILGIVIILQVVTLVRQNLPLVVCPATDCSSVSPLTGDNKDLHKQLSQLINITDKYMSNTQNNTDLLYQLLEITQGSAQMLSHVVNSLLSLETTNSATQGAIDDILVVVEKLLSIQNGSFIFSSHLPISCQDIKQKQPDSPSGYYNLNGKLTYCYMEALCNTDGAWTRLGQFDMSDSTVNCPSGFKLYTSGGVRACGRPSGGPSCLSIKLQSNGISYSQVCGRVVGYQYGSADAVDTRFISDSKHNDINSYYVDGVSITQGYPRKHIWTLMAGVKESYFEDGNCPCNTPSPSTQSIQAFVGSDYFCESGNPNNGWSYKLYSNDPLWDGEGCGSQEGSCCSVPDLPWFHKTLDDASNDYVELRVCGDQTSVDEDVPISFYEIYVK